VTKRNEVSEKQSTRNNLQIHFLVSGVPH